MHKHCEHIRLLLWQKKLVQSVQRVTICQDSTHLPLELYISCEIFEQILYNHQQLQFTSFTVFPASKSTGQAIGDKCLEEFRHSSRQTPWQRSPKCSVLFRYGALKLWRGSCRLSKCDSSRLVSEQQSARVYEKNDLQ